MTTIESRSLLRLPGVAALGAVILALMLMQALGTARAQDAGAMEQPAGEEQAQPAPQPAAQPATAPAADEETQPAAPMPAEGEEGMQPAAPPETEPAATGPAANGEPTPPAPTPPAVSPDEPISLNFKDAPLRTVLEYLSQAAGLVVVEDARVEGRITVMSRQQISVEEAISLLDTVLRQQGYAAVRMGRTLKIVTVEQAKREFIPVRMGNDPQQIEPSDRMITQIIPIRYADATKLKADLATLIPSTTDVASNASSNTLIVTGTESVVRRLVEIIQAIDVHMSEVSQVKVFQLKYANAASAARLITELFKPDQATQGQAAQFGGRRRFVMPDGSQPGGGAATDDASQRATKVTASADDRTNTLVVSAAPDVLSVIEGMVKQLDANPAEDQAVFIYPLKNGQAANLQGILNSVFGWTGTPSTGTAQTQQTGRGSSSGTGSAFGSRMSGSGSRGLSSNNAGATGSSQQTGSTRRTSGTSNRGLSSSAAAAASDLAGKVYVVADADTNSLVVTTATKNFERVKEIIADLDRAVPQVLIKILIAEVTHDKNLDLGVEFSMLNIGKGGRGSQAGTNFKVAAQSTGFIFSLEERDVTAAVNALAEVAKLDILSRPYILTSDNQEASIMVGQEVPFITNTRTTDTGQTINTIEYDDIGIILTVTPHINPQGLVTMDVSPEISTLTGDTVPISETVNAPVFAKRSAQSRVAIRDGQTIVIGGLMEDRNTTNIKKVPILGDIPILGALFRRSIEEKTKTELLIFLTPHVAQQPDDLQGMSESEKAGAKIIPHAVEEGAFQEHLDGLNRGGSSSSPEQKAAPQPAEQPPAEQPPATTPSSGEEDEPQP